VEGPRAAGTTESRAQALHDAALVIRFNSGDESAFEEIVERYREKMTGIAFGVLKNVADAEEIAQDTFVRAHRGLAKFRGDSSLATWLHRVTINLSRNRYWYFHRRRRHATMSLDSPLQENGQGTFADLVAADTPDPARAATTREFSELIAQCMEQLEPSQREVLTLRNLLHQSYDEISRKLGLKVGTVKSRIARARENLRLQLTESSPEFAANSDAADWLEPVRPVGRSALLFA
jgi:RNA polymerase sigma-70 factor (ECF subfamily)